MEAAGGVEDMLQGSRMETGAEAKAALSKDELPKYQRVPGGLCPPAQLSLHWEGAGSTRHVLGFFPDL